ncbi:hypothetical protein [Fictibacillus sp. FJAT-27399]|uniref:hypothetical protein n=1 Tax=Fictibacillus sp. FJAT-27399 TaxID=1729689 RepID=UPI000A7734CB|nr:hypothetical protein [Fictibacillus sp. FJAT-27399]
MISVPGCSLSAGRAVSLTGVNAYFLVQAPAGVSPVTLRKAPAAFYRTKKM